jgi:hypothetical protein
VARRVAFGQRHRRQGRDLVDHQRGRLLNLSSKPQKQAYAVIKASDMMVGID